MTLIAKSRLALHTYRLVPLELSVNVKLSAVVWVVHRLMARIGC